MCHMSRISRPAFKSFTLALFHFPSICTNLFKLVRAMPFYAVAKGKKPGIYKTWPECESQVKGFQGASFKKFSTLTEAKAFCKERGGPTPSTSGIRIPGRAMMLTPFVVKPAAVSNKRKHSSDDTATPSTSSSSNKKGPSSFCWVPYGSRGDYSDTVIVYTDGACSANGQKNATAGIGVYWGDDHEDNVSEPLTGSKQTNNKAEIQAVVTAVNQAKARGHKSVTIRTDSKFLLDSITMWIHKWIRNNWVLSTGGPVKNKEDFQELIEAMKGIDVNWEKVPAHRGIKGNEMADRLAVEGAKKRARLA